MKSVLRIALVYFTFVPLMSWLGLIGGALLGLGIILALANGTGVGPMVLAIMGVFLIVVGPVFGGGPVLRYASSLNTMLLRPNARVRLLLGTTLALTIVALLITLPFLLDGPTGTRGREPPDPAQVFQIAWGVMALNWICVFSVTRFRYGLVFIWIVPVVTVNLFQNIPSPELPEPSTVLIAGMILWVVFAAWHLGRRRHGPVATILTGGGAQSDAVNPAVPFPAPAHLPAPRSAAEAQRQLLHGGVPLINHVVVGAAQALLIVVMFTWLVDKPQVREATTLRNMLYIGVLISCFSIGCWLVGRTRTLWLRTGFDRAGLLHFAETAGLLPAMVSSLVATLVIIIAQASQRPDLLPTIALNALTQLAMAACLAYWGMSVTRPWSFGLVLECIGFFVLFIVNVAALGANRPAGRLLVALVVLALFAVVLRERARRRWRTLDWRAARPQFANQWRAPAWRRG